MISIQARAALHEVLLQAALRAERTQSERLSDARAKAMASHFDSDIQLNRVPFNPTESGVNHERADNRS